MAQQFDNEEFIIQFRAATRNGNFVLLHVEPRRGVAVHDPFAFITYIFPILSVILTDNFEGVNDKYHGRMEVSFIKQDGDGSIMERCKVWFISRAYQIDDRDDINSLMNWIGNDFATRFREWIGQGSGWTFYDLHQLDILRARYDGRRGQHGSQPVAPKLPPFIPKQSVVSLDRANKIGGNIGPNCFVDAVYIATLFARDEAGTLTFVRPRNARRPSEWVKVLKNTEIYDTFTFHKLLSQPYNINVDHVYHFENDNPGYFINILTARAGTVCPLRRIKRSIVDAYEESSGNSATILNLLLHKEHYFPVKTLRSLLKESDKNRRRYFCYSCLAPFNTKEILQCHYASCGKGSTNVFKYVMPSEEQSEMNFERWVREAQRHPFAFYADSECYHEVTCTAETGQGTANYTLTSEAAADNLHNKPKNTTATTVTDIHRPYMMAYYLALCPKFKAVIDRVIPLDKRKQLFPEYPDKLYKVFRGENCVNEFQLSLIEFVERLYKLFKFHNRPHSLTDEEASELRWNAMKNDAVYCCLCGGGGDFINDNCDDLCPVIDHDHWTGEVRGVAHNKCNRAAKRESRFFPVFFHNFRGYDCHVLSKNVQFNSSLGGRQISFNTICQTQEKYLSLTLKWKVDEFTPKGVEKSIPLYLQLRYLDSLQFLNRPLGYLIERLNANLANSKLGDESTIFQHTLSVLGEADLQHLLPLAKRKGVFPHNYITSSACLDESELPPLTAFTCGLNSLKGITEADYQHALSAWAELDCKTLWDYADFYLRVDVGGLADVMEKFRQDSYNSYHIDPVFQYSLPGFSWRAMFRFTQVTLDLLLDKEMYFFYEESIRGGLTQLTKHYVKAENNYTMPEKYNDINDYSSHLYLLDANGLYSWAMTQYLPTGEHEWIDDEEVWASLFPTDNLDAWPVWNGDWGYTIMCDLDYPPEIHYLTQSLPLAPNREEITAYDYTETMMKEYIATYPCASGIKTEKKLVATQRDKKNYIVHYRLLNLYLKLGMKLQRIIKVVRFKQSAFMAPYINYNIEQRKVNKEDPMLSDFYKLLNNSVYGKTQEQQRKHLNMRLESRPDYQRRLVARDTYQGSVIFTEDLAGIFLSKEKARLAHPIYLGSTILDLSKLLMYHFYYNVIKQTFNSVEVIYTDTDSLLLFIEGENTMDKLVSLKKLWLDGSNYTPDHPLYHNENRGVLGMFKDEMDGDAISEVVALRPKMYAIKSVSGGKTRAKGINKTVVKEQLNFNNYIQVYQEAGKTPIYREQSTFRSKLHEIETIKQRKKALTLGDNKRCWTGVNTSFPFGHIQLDHLPSPDEIALRYFNKTCKQMCQPKMRQVKAYKKPQDLTVPANGGDGDVTDGDVGDVGDGDASDGDVGDGDTSDGDAADNLML